MIEYGVSGFFRSPTPNTECLSQVIVYSLTGDQAWTVWDAQVGVQSFAKWLASTTVEQIARILFAGITDIISTDRNTITSDAIELVRQIEAMKADLIQYQAIFNGGITRSAL